MSRTLIHICSGNRCLLNVRCTLINIISKSAGRLLALADVELDFDGVVVEINSIRIEREPNGVSVRMPVDRDGRALVVLPDEVKDAISDIILGGALAAGIVKERVKVSVPVG
jgi:DNA-binding cell septation regulator SpoVG